MQSTFGTLLAGVLLAVAGCGDDGDGATDTNPPPATEDSVEWRLVKIVTGTAAGGTVSRKPASIETAAQLASFSRQFTRPGLVRDLRQVWTTSSPEDGTLLAAVVTIGCDVPTGVTYDDGIVRPQVPVPPMKQCLAPMTSVAVLSVG